jgi:hopanoid biosynthesis associated RND transporter like protein HpnN
VALSYEEMEVVRSQAAMAGLASFVLVGLILSLGLRSARLVLATLLTLLVGLAWTAGFTAVAIGHFNMISVSFAVLFIGLGVDFGIHFGIRYRELASRGVDHGHALGETARSVGSSICLCATTTAIGFFAFAPTDFVGVAELGLISGAGMFISLFCTLTLLPALVSLRPVSFRTEFPGGPAWKRAGLIALPVRHPRGIRASALALGLGAVFLLPKARFDNNPLNVRDPSSESVRTFNELLEKGGPSPWSINAIAEDVASANILAEELRKLDTVERVITVTDYIPADQKQKLDIIGDVAMFLAPPPREDGTVPAPHTGEQVAALRDLAGSVQKLLAEGSPPELEVSARGLDADLARYLSYLAGQEDPSQSR